MVHSLPAKLTRPLLVDGNVAAKLLLDLTVYLVGPSVQEFDFLLDLYKRLCPPGRLKMYTIAEQQDWEPVAQPHLTASGRAAAVAGLPWPYMEPTRKRLREGRAFEAGLWDGEDIENPAGGWSFLCRGILLKKSGLHAFVRFLMPLDTTPSLLHEAASSIADHVRLRSGHAGPCSIYDSRLIEDAFDAIYPLARRYWGLDLEDLNDTLPLTATRIKGINWLTLVGNALLAEHPKVSAEINELRGTPHVALEGKAHGVVLRAGAEPVAGDQNHPDGSLDPYFAVGRALAPLHLDQHPDFPGKGFLRHGNTVGWIRRFADPHGWR